MITSSDPYCPACDSGTTYWTFSTMDGDVWYCGSCGHQWMVEVGEMINDRRGDGLGDHTRDLG